MKYKLRELLIQKELNGLYAMKTGRHPDALDARIPLKENIIKPASQFRYCWQSNDNKRIKDLFKSPRDK